MNRRIIYLVYSVFFISFLFLVLSLFFYFLFKVPINSYTLFASTAVAPDGIGFDLNDSALTFGVVGPGGTSMRQLSFANNYSFPVKVELVVNGELRNLIEYSVFTKVKSGEKVLIPLTVIAPGNATYRNYTGSVDILVLRDR